MRTAEYLPSLYMPMDRWYGLANGLRIPEYTTGTALFADISGFTSLTETLVTAFGTQSGLEALALHTNSIYTVLIAEVHRYHGSVIGFSGDGVTCWFDAWNHADDYSALRAAACAQGMQQAMRPFSALKLPYDETVALSVKVALATGAARRLLVGDPNHRLQDILAGSTVQRMAHAEQAARCGEIVVDRPTACLLGSRMALSEWRTVAETGERFAIITGLTEHCPPDPWDIPPSLPAELVRPWLFTKVYDQLRDGLADFSTEMQRTVAVFLRFSGIDYDGDSSAGEKLNAYIDWVQSVLMKFGGLLVNITFGDKGSYLFAAFGAAAASEHDATNAVNAAMVLNKPPA